jgi:hypothetical protein
MSKSHRTLLRVLAKTWAGRLAHFRKHRHDEHLEALFDEARRFAGIQLENDLASSVFWSSAPLPTRAALLLYLVDRGAVCRRIAGDRVVFDSMPGAEAWVASQAELASHIVPALELVTALRMHQARRTPSA